MTTTSEMIEVMSSYEMGEVIEWTDNSGITPSWRETNNPRWNWGSYSYRVKPESIVLYACFTTTFGYSHSYLNKKEAELWVSRDTSRRSYKVMEEKVDG